MGFQDLEEFNNLLVTNQPHEVFKLDWNTYYPIDFANTFLPKVSGYQCKGVRFYDGAKLLSGLKKSSRKLLPLKDSNELITIITCTYPKGVEAERKKKSVQPANHEIATFIEIDQTENAFLTFRFGNNFKAFLYSQKLSADLLEEINFKTTIKAFKEHFDNTLSHHNMMDFIFKTINIDSSKAYGNTDKGKLEHFLRDNKIDGFIYKNTCSSNNQVIIQGTIIDGWLELKYIDNSQIDSITKLKLSEEKNVIAFNQKDIWSKSDLAIAKEYNNGNCPDLETPITDEEINHISNLITEHIEFTKLKGSKKQFAALSKEIEKQINNPFYADVNLCVKLTVAKDKEQTTKSNKPLDGGITSIPIGIENGNHTRTWPEDTSLCEIGLDITIDSNGELKIKHQVSDNYLKEFSYWPNEIKKRGLDKDINLEELRQQVLDDFTSDETERSFLDSFIQDTKAFFSEQVGGYIEAIHSTQKIAKNVWKEGQVNESTWHSDKDEFAEEHKQWPKYVQLNPLVGGGTDGIIDEIVGIPMAIKGIYGIATDEKQRKAIKELFTKEGLSKILDGLKDEVEEIRNDEQKAQHFGAKTTVTVVTMFFGVGFITKTGKLGEAISTVTTKATKVVSAKVMATIKEIKDWFRHRPKDRIHLDNYQKDFGENGILNVAQDAASDPEKLSRLKKTPKPFIDGKRFEKNIENLIDAGDETLLTKFANKADISFEELTSHTKLHQVQINLPNGGYTVADTVWIKIIDDGLGNKSYDLIINECKLSKATKFTTRQNEFIEAIGKADSKFTLRNTKFEEDFKLEQGIELNVKTYIRTNTQGKPNVLDNLDITKIK